MLQKQQMELGFDAARARWWFEQMHRVVDRACDWQPAPPARPDQSYLALAP